MQWRPSWISKMKIFISQRVSGMDREKLKEETKRIKGVLEAKGHEIVSVIDYPPEFVNYSVKRRLSEYAFKRMDESDIILAIIRGEERSEGMLMEIGHILNTDKKIILLIKKEVRNTYLRDMAEKVIEFEDADDLIKQLDNLN